MAAKLLARTVFNARSLSLVGKAYVSRPTIAYRSKLTSCMLPQTRAFSLSFPRLSSGEGKKRTLCI